MSFEYEALVGYLHVVGGRTISMAPPGALVEVAPKKAMRGRETDTFFALILPSGHTVAPTAFYERMAQRASELYFDSSSSVTAGIRHVVNTLNYNLLEHNQDPKTPTYEVNMLCAVLRGDDLIIGRVGGGVVLLNIGGQFISIPGNLHDDESLFDVPLGIQSILEANMSRYRIVTGTRLIFTDYNVADFAPEHIRSALQQPDIGMTLVAFKELARLHLTLLSVEFVPPETPAPLPVPEGQSTFDIVKNIRKTSDESKKQRKRISRTTIYLQHLRQGIATVARYIAEFLDLINRIINHYFNKSESNVSENKKWYSAPFTTGAAVLIPVIIVAVVVVFWLSSTGESEFEVCIQEANNLAQSAREVPSSNPDALLALWSTAITEAQRCETLRPDDLSAEGLIREGQEVVDAINQIERRELSLLDSLPGAVFTRILREGSDLYVLDSARNAVYHGIIADNGLSMQQRLEPILDMREGANVDGFAIGEIFDIAFSQSQNSIYALDTEGRLVVCTRRQKQGCVVQRLLRWEDWMTPVAINVWGSDDRLYILDPQMNQIWRYDRLGGTYGGVPTLYFAGQNQGSIGNAIDFAINRTGNVYVLREDGVMLQYNLGQIQDFRLGGFPEGQEPTTANSMYLDEDPLGQALYVTNRNLRTIYQMTQGGSHWATYRVFDETLFESLDGVVSNPAQELLYPISGNSIFILQQ